MEKMEHIRKLAAETRAARSKLGGAGPRPHEGGGVELAALMARAQRLAQPAAAPPAPGVGGGRVGLGLAPAAPAPDLTAAA